MHHIPLKTPPTSRAPLGFAAAFSMSRRQRAVTTTLSAVGAVSLVVSLGLATLGRVGVAGVNAGFGLYRVLALALGVALIARAAELRSADAWNYLDSWWNGSSADRRVLLGRYLGILGQLVLLLLLIRTFQLEHPVFWSRIAPLIVAGCVIHHLTPARYRLSMFLFLSLAAIWLVFSVADALWLVGVGVGLVTLCHLPIAYWMRATLVLVSGAALAIGRVNGFPVPWSRAIWPILGSIFMFRMIVYLYDLRHEEVPASWSQRLAYFFLLPNVVFPLFPIVDYGMFRKTYYDAEAYRIYQRGVEWIFRGIVHLIAYRFLYQRWSITPSEVTSLAGIAQYMVVGFLLYVRVSGQFHLIVGVLHLFGFHLPPTHEQYFLASSFSDLWRRINIYWKDFMLKVFYYPVLFRLRRFGERRAMILATLGVFVVTWVLHSYQSFWLLGSFPLSATDAVFWSVLAALLMVSTLREARHGRVRALTVRSWTPRALATHSLKVAGTFGLMAFLWSLWMSPTFGDWLALWSVADLSTGTARSFDATPVWVLGVAATSAAVLSRSPWLLSFKRPGGDLAFSTRVVVSATSMAAVFIVSQPPVSSRLGDRVGAAIASLRTSQLNREDRTRLAQGYYEELMSRTPLNSELWAIYLDEPAPEERGFIGQTRILRNTNDFLRWEFAPNMQIRFLGETMTTNRWGMRDKDYERAKPAGVRRFAIVGASQEMGWGVADGEAYEQLVEDRLNSSHGDGAGRFEIMNFAVAGHTVLHELVLLDRILSFAPDVVILPGREVDAGWAIDHLVERHRARVRIPIDFLRAAAETAGLGRVPDAVAKKRLQARQNELLQMVYVEMSRRIRERGAVPVWAFVPVPDQAHDSTEVRKLVRLATNAGFEALDISDAFAGHDLNDLRLAMRDRHPNKTGHQLLADRLYRSLIDHPHLVHSQPESTTR